MSASRYFLDTDIFIYMFDGKAFAKAKKAVALVTQAVDSGQGIISYQVAQEFLNVALRHFMQPLTPAEAEQYFLTILKPLLAVHSSPALYLDALRVASRYKLSWYDALIVAAALESQCKTLYSEDLRIGLSIEGLRIENPFAT
jgi:predicted nucleic acid-binding protein